MALVTFIGQLKSKRFDECGNCFVTLDIDTCYKERQPSWYGTEPHTPKCNEFIIENKRPWSCGNDIDLATNCETGHRMAIIALEIFDMKGQPIDRYQVVDIRTW